MDDEQEKNYCAGHSYDTSSVREQDRLAYWGEFVSRSIMGVSMRTSSPESFSGKIQIYTLGDSAMSFSQASACAAVSAADRHSRPGGGEPKEGWWVVHHRRDGCIAQGRADNAFKAGDVLFIDSNRPYRRDESSVDATSIFLEHTSIGDACVLRQLDDMAGHRVDGSRAGWSRLLSQTLNGMTPELARHLGVDQIERQLFFDHMRHILLLALRESKGREVGASIACANVSKLAQHQLFLRMQNWLRENFWRPSLTAQCLATEFGVSTRYVHQLYANHLDRGSFLGTLRTLRLTEAMRMLGSPECCSWSVAEISYRCGFSNPAYFGLIFRRWFGCTPSAARARLFDRATAAGLDLGEIRICARAE